MSKINGATAPSPISVAPGNDYRPSFESRPWRKIAIAGELAIGAGIIRFVHHTGVDPGGGPSVAQTIRVVDSGTGLCILNITMNPTDSALLYIPFDSGISIPPNDGATEIILAGD